MRFLPALLIGSLVLLLGVAVSYSVDVPKWNDLGVVKAKYGDFDEAIHHFTQALEAVWPPDEYQAAIYSNLCYAYNGKGEYDKAIENCNQAMRAKSDYPPAINNRAFAYRKKNKYDKALEGYNEAWYSNLTSYKAAMGRGLNYFDSFHYDQAAKDFKSMTHSRQPEMVYASILLYLAMMHQGQNGKKMLETKANLFDLNKWPGPVFSLFLEEISPKTLLNQAEDPDLTISNKQQCEAYFFIEEWLLLKSQEGKSRRMFKKDLTTCTPVFYELIGATVELKSPWF